MEQWSGVALRDVVAECKERRQCPVISLRKIKEEEESQVYRRNIFIY
jgi:DMSO/TMAO reductase YedYZ molybdopterin-dependent catalytic subunit